MPNKHIIFSIFIIIVVSAIAWMSSSFYRTASIDTVKSVSLPDAIMEDVKATIMSKEGQIRMIVVTPKLVHYPKNDVTYFTSPQLTLYRGASPMPWLVNAIHAKAIYGVDQITFWDNVTINHEADSKNPPTLIKTDTLMVHPNKQTAETLDLITMIQPNTIIKAIGMYADMNTGNIQLRSQTRGEYAPSS